MRTSATANPAIEGPRKRERRIQSIDGKTGFVVRKSIYLQLAIFCASPIRCRPV